MKIGKGILYKKKSLSECQFRENRLGDGHILPTDVKEFLLPMAFSILLDGSV